MMEVYHGRILCTSIISLPILRRRVMEREKETYQVLVFHFRRIVPYVYDLNMTCFAGAYLAICWVRRCVHLVAHEANCVTKKCLLIARVLEIIYKIFFCTPVTACAKGCVIFIFVSARLVHHRAGFHVLLDVTLLAHLCFWSITINSPHFGLGIRALHLFVIFLFEEAAKALIEEICLRLRHYH